MTNLWQLIVFWKRFIDDVFGLWTGSIRQFHLFVKKLNELAKEFGLQFGDSQIGKSVNYLDMTISLVDNNILKYQLFVKETDARLYLETDTFHPAHVFKSVVFSQMMRVIQRNSNDSTCVEDLERLKEDMVKSGHSEDMVNGLEPLAVQRVLENELLDFHTPKEPTEQVVFSVKYFKELGALKS